jgi:hypothetical protein
MRCSADPELEFGWRIVAAIAGVGEDALEPVADQRLHVRNGLGQGVPVTRVASLYWPGWRHSELIQAYRSN